MSAPRIGFTATRRAVGGAVQRNRARRRLREAARVAVLGHAPASARAPLVAATDYVIIAHREIPGCSFAELVRELETGFAALEPRLVAAQARL